MLYVTKHKFGFPFNGPDAILSLYPALRTLHAAPSPTVIMASAVVKEVRMRSMLISWLRCWSSWMVTRSSVSLMYSCTVCGTRVPGGVVRCASQGCMPWGTMLVCIMAGV